MLTFAVPAQLTSAPISPAPISSRCVRRNNEQRSFDRVASMLSVAMTAALARSKSRRKVMLFSSDRDADEAGGPVALVLRSKLQELAKTTSAQRAAKRWQELGNAKVLMPENSIPWGVTHFIGGAVLGQFPELCYSSLLQPFVDKTGMAVICTPYELSRDHQEIADVAASDFAEAFELGEERFGWAKDRMPRLAMGHSLGAKLQVLLSCQRPHPMLAGVALLAFNNFGVEDQARQVTFTSKAWHTKHWAVRNALKITSVHFGKKNVACTSLEAQETLFMGGNTVGSPFFSETCLRWKGLHSL
ncbi:unnamed protein product [Durusdinium trenchii]|uniref:Chlorophyllase n=1 Tax=Durusdinium trenchii TaxID=1381693 RepID=A0ABP0MAW0_9DINO